jgi:hypothetical protein
LANIPGIGHETVLDIKRLYKTIDNLRDALILDSVPLRNDVVKKLKEYIIPGV